MDINTPHPHGALAPGVEHGPATLRAFRMLLGNTLIANVTTSYLWFALTFWAYLETRSVLATAIIGGSYMLLIAVFGTMFGALVDRHKKLNVMLASSAITLVAFVIAGLMYWQISVATLIDWQRPAFWAFVGIILLGAVVESMRNIALSTTVTLLVPADGRDKANGLVGTVQGVAFMVTSIFSGLSIGLLGMGGTMVIAIALTALSLGHLLTVRIPEAAPHRVDGVRPPTFDIKTAVRTIRSVPGLSALILFASFNNLIGGVYMALMDPYGLTLFSVEAWGVVLGVTSVGFIIGGGLVARFGLGSAPLRTLMLVNAIGAMVGIVFAIRELWWLYAAGILVYMCVIPAAEAAEQAIMQRVVPFAVQGRVFGFAQSVEVAASPISAFMIAPIAQFGLIPYMQSEAGQERFGWLVGDGEARGIALVFISAGVVLLAAALLALVSRPYRRLAAAYAAAAPQEQARPPG